MFSIRYIDNVIGLRSYLFPKFIKKNNEISFLYGKRFIDDNESLSFSGGISYFNYFDYIIIDHDGFLGPYQTSQLVSTENNFGFPFEAEIRWFNSDEKRYRIFYGLIPIGEPTGFCRSFGIKLIGNISKHSYAGIGLVVGFGFHKQY